MKALVELWRRLNEGPTSIYGAKMALTLPLFYVRSEHAAVRGEVGSGKLESPVLQPPIIHERTNKSIKLRVLQPPARPIHQHQHQQHQHQQHQQQLLQLQRLRFGLQTTTCCVSGRG